MCTLSVVTRDDGYYLAMNRDERITRGEAAQPARIDLKGMTAIYPQDGAGGTWIASNNHGITLALLNRNDFGQPIAEKTRSRGEVIPALIAFSSYPGVQTALQGLDLQGIWPFRLVGVFPAEKKISEWRWNQKTLDSQSHDWKPRHWFSSGLSDEQATAERGAVCQSAWNEPDAGSLPWLRRLHASHTNGPGPFSICVHRENVETLSYTEISCGPEKIKCVYSGGSPCTPAELRGSVEMACTFGNAPT